MMPFQQPDNTCEHGCRVDDDHECPYCTAEQALKQVAELDKALRSILYQDDKSGEYRIGQRGDTSVEPWIQKLLEKSK